MKLYTFVNEYDEIIVEVRADNHDQAVAAASASDRLDGESVDYTTDFYSETIKESPCTK